MVLWCIEFSKGSDGKCNICAVLDNFNRGRISFDKNPLFRVIIIARNRISVLLAVFSRFKPNFVAAFQAKKRSISS